MAKSRTDILAERSLPHSLETERSILGVILLDNTTLHQALEILRRDDFYLDAHRRVFDKMVYLYEKGRPIDPVTLREELARFGELEQVGGTSFVASLMDGVPQLQNIEHYARIVRDRSVLRKMILASNQTIAKCFDQEEDPQTILDQAERAFFDIAEERLTTGFVTVADVARRQLEEVERMAGRPQMITGLPTGFTELDQITSGLQPTDMIVVAGRPSSGKTSLALSIAQNAAHKGHTVGVISLEMSKEQLVVRMLCSEARINLHRFRGGFLSRDEWGRLAEALGRLAESRIFIDDTPAISALEVRAKARRLKHEHGLDLLIVDYLQLMPGRGRVESRQQEVSQISRDMKAIAKDIHVPLIAISQLSRAPETRTDHRPQLSDLRESGCLAGDTLVTLADSGMRVPISQLVGKSGFRVWALNEQTWKLEAAQVSRAFSTGRKPVYRLTTRLGRVICATGNHKFRAFEEWQRLDRLKVGDRIALPRRIPTTSHSSLSHPEVALLGHLIGDGCTLPSHAIQYTTRELDLAEYVVGLAKQVFGERVKPRIHRERRWYQVYLSAGYRLTHRVHNPVVEWLTDLGAFGFRSYEKRVPERVFEQPEDTIAVFLRHLWATDGCIHPPHGSTRHPTIYYATSSEGLARDVQSLLLRLRINAVVRPISQHGKGRTQFHVMVMGRNDILAFAERLGAVGESRGGHLCQCVEWVKTRVANTNRDVLPREVWPVLALPAMMTAGLTHRQMQAALGNAYCGHNLYKQNISRERAARLAAVVHSQVLAALSQSDVYWDEITAIEPQGETAVYDLTVDRLHNFVAGDIIAHNSIEQDSDVVIFVYREEMYGPTEENAGIAEIIIGKQRNGPTGTVRLAFLKEFTRFENLWHE